LYISNRGDLRLFFVCVSFDSGASGRGSVVGGRVRTRCGGCHGNAIGRNLVVKLQSRTVRRNVIKLQIGPVRIS